MCIMAGRTGCLEQKPSLQMSLSPLRNIALTSTWQLSLSPLLIHTTRSSGKGGGECICGQQHRV